MSDFTTISRTIQSKTGEAHISSLPYVDSTPVESMCFNPFGVDPLDDIAVGGSMSSDD